MNPEAVRDLVGCYFQRLLNERDVSVCDELLAPDYVDHDAPPDTPPGPGSVKAFVTKFLDDYPDLHIRIADIVADTNKAAARIVWNGTHRLDGTPFHQTGNIILHLNERGQFVERWSAYRTDP